METCNATLNPSLRSWVTSANLSGSDFPIQNLPFGRFRTSSDEPWRIGVAIGDMVLDLKAAELINHSDMNQLLAMKKEDRVALRIAISNGLKEDAPVNHSAFEQSLFKQSSVEIGMPCEVGDFTDFYVGIHHATAVGKLFRPDNPLLPNYKWVPIGYHGRSSTLNVSGTSFPRPCGQVKAADTDAPIFQPSARLDFELEIGVVIGQGNQQGQPIAIEKAEDHVFGLTLFNDWSARDIQAWEYQPLGPFLGKNFASTVSPWIVTMEALEPFRTNFKRPSERPNPLPYLNSVSNSDKGAFDIRLEVLFQSEFMRQAGLPFERISYSGFKESAYWTVAQLVTHHTVNGCALRPGDLLGTGTLSGPLPEQAGSMLELSNGGKKPMTLSNGEQRTFLQDGDTIALKAWCEKPGAMRIGFGECIATVLPTMKRH
jgi:fumarylacetoacetase